MFLIAKHQIVKGFSDAKIIFAALFVLLAFITNGVVYSGKIETERNDWQRLVATTNKEIAEAAENLQDVSDLDQLMTKPFSSLAFIADDGAIPLPNSLEVDAFSIGDISRNNTINEELPVLPPLDWSFIVVYFISIVCILLSYDTICGEKQSGTLRQILSHPVSRLSVFGGKYFGLVITVTLMLVVGTLLSLLVLLFNNALSFTPQIVFSILWAELLSIILLSLFALISMLISSLVAQPRVSLIILMVTWVVMIVIIPGATALLGEQLVNVPSAVEIRNEIRNQVDEIWQSAPDGAGRWNGNPFAEWMPDRMKVYSRQRDVIMNQTRQLIQLKMDQVKSSNTLTWISPVGLYTTFLQEKCNTGVYGFENLYNNALKYIASFEDYVKQKDASDDESAHLVYHTGYGIEEGTFSRKPIEASSVPRWYGMWETGGLPTEEQWPALQLIILLIVNVQIALLAFWAFHRYDPR